MTHEAEIKYWATHEDGTKVWYKTDENVWIDTSCPSWIPNMEYIVNNEWAKLRKAQADGKQLQRRVPNHFGRTIAERNEFTEWEDDTLDIFTPDYLDAHWRIKPEEVYEWQWVCQREDGTFFIPFKFFTTKEDVENYLGYNSKIIKKYKPSKRIKKR